MSASLLVPLSVTAKTKEDLSKQILKVQSQEGGKVSIINICQDVTTKEWVCWYLPLRSLGGGLF